jgi:hypothetical protein
MASNSLKEKKTTEKAKKLFLFWNNKQEYNLTHMKAIYVQ